MNNAHLLSILFLSFISLSFSSEIFYTTYSALMKTNADGTGTATTVTSIVDGTGVASDGEWLYYAERSNREVWKVRVDGTEKTRLVTIQTTGTLEQIILEPTDFGRHKLLYVIDTACNIYSLHLNGSHFRNEIKVNTTRPHSYICLGIDAYQGFVYVTASSNTGAGGDLVQVDVMTGQQKTIFHSPVATPNGVAVYNSSLLFFSDWSGGVIYSINPDGGYAVSFVFAPPVNGPTQLTIGLDTLYWGHNGGKIGSVNVNGSNAKMFNVGFCWGIAWCFSCGPTTPTSAPTHPGPTTAPTAPSSFGPRLYFGSGNVYVLDLQTKMVSKFADANNAAGMVVYKDKLYFVDAGLRQICWVALTGGPVHVIYTFNSTFLLPQGMYLQESDFGVPYLYIVELSEGKLWRATLDGNHLEPVVDLDTKTPLQVAFGEGYFFVTSVANSEIVRISAFTGEQKKMETIGGPNGIAIRNKEIYYTGFTNGKVYKMSLTGENRTLLHALDRGYGIALSSDKLYAGSLFAIASMGLDGSDFEILANQYGWGVAYCEACPSVHSALQTSPSERRAEIPKDGSSPTRMRYMDRA